MDWDRTRRFVLYRSRWLEQSLTVVFESETPGVQELKALRSLRVDYGRMPPAHLKALVGDSRRFELGRFREPEASSILSKATALGLHIEAVERSQVSHCIVDTTDEPHAIWLIEDDVEAERLALEMIAAGVPVRELRPGS